MLPNCALYNLTLRAVQSPLRANRVNMSNSYSFASSQPRSEEGGRRLYQSSWLFVIGGLRNAQLRSAELCAHSDARAVRRLIARQRVSCLAAGINRPWRECSLACVRIGSAYPAELSALTILMGLLPGNSGAAAARRNRKQDQTAARDSGQ